MDYSFPSSNLKFNPFDTKTDLTTFKYADAIAAPQNMTEGQFMGKIYPGLLGLIEQNRYNSSPAGMKELLELGRKDASEKAKEQFKWSTLAKFPSAIATAFGGVPNSQEMFRQGANAITGTYANTLAAFPQAQVPGTSIQQNRYFTL